VRSELQLCNYSSVREWGGESPETRPAQEVSSVQVSQGAGEGLGGTWQSYHRSPVTKTGADAIRPAP